MYPAWLILIRIQVFYFSHFESEAMSIKSYEDQKETTQKRNLKWCEFCKFMAYSQTQTNWLFIVTMLEGKFPKNEESEWIFQIYLKYKQK